MHSSEHADVALKFQHKAAAQLAIALAQSDGKPSTEIPGKHKAEPTEGLHRGRFSDAEIGTTAPVELIDQRMEGKSWAEFGDEALVLTQDELRYLGAAHTIVDAITKAAGSWRMASEAYQEQQQFRA